MLEVLDRGSREVEGSHVRQEGVKEEGVEVLGRILGVKSEDADAGGVAREYPELEHKMTGARRFQMLLKGSSEEMRFRDRESEG